MNRKEKTAPGLNTPKLLNPVALERSEVVANACMNRERNLAGANSYEADLGLAPMDFLMSALQRQREVSWLDLCCGSGRALLQAAEAVQRAGLESRMELTGIDLVPMFHPIPTGLAGLRFVAASVETWEPEQKFDLITCVHGLHYVGDKLAVLQRASTWLKPDGLFMAHLDYRNVQIIGHKHSGQQIGKDLRRAGFEYIPGRHLLIRKGNTADANLLYRYLGADDQAGPNYTGQPAVASHYERIKP